MFCMYSLLTAPLLCGKRFEAVKAERVGGQKIGIDIEGVMQRTVNVSFEARIVCGILVILFFFIHATLAATDDPWVERRLKNNPLSCTECVK